MILIFLIQSNAFRSAKHSKTTIIQHIQNFYLSFFSFPCFFFFDSRSFLCFCFPVLSADLSFSPKTGNASWEAFPVSNRIHAIQAHRKTLSRAASFPRRFPVGAGQALPVFRSPHPPSRWRNLRQSAGRYKEFPNFPPPFSAFFHYSTK